MPRDDFVGLPASRHASLAALAQIMMTEEIFAGYE
jgi:hypothetical protein